MSPSDSIHHQAAGDDLTTRFYDGLAGDYHLIYADWESAIERQGQALDATLRARHGKRPPLRLLDCSCGIGTQSLGLAARGYEVTATDLSPQAVARCAREARIRGLEVVTAVADMRDLGSLPEGAFDIVISCDNAVPHLLGDADLEAAVTGMRARLKAGGLVAIGMRDYDQLRLQRPKATPVRVLDEGRRLVFQVWDWEADGERYRYQHFLLRQTEAGWTTDCLHGEYRALAVAELRQALERAGFVDIRHSAPEESGHMEQLLTARVA
jgi:SAM-dependent methyltransferase